MQHALYLHIPFCTHRCAYCDFNTYAGQAQSIPQYVTALCHEIHRVGQTAPANLTLHTVFFGGGTPSLLSKSELGSILIAIRRAFALTAEAEITVEANPGTISLDDLQSMHSLGINRLSLGVQSANGEELRLLERTHDFLDVLNAVTAARRAGMENLNLDLIYGLPSQSMSTWQTTVRRVLKLRPEHISAYALTLEHGTPFGRWSAKGLMEIPNADVAADMYGWLSEELQAAGYFQYEISNWSRPGYECRHNLQYWRGLPYLGLGAGAHGYAGGYRYSNVLGIKAYIARFKHSVDSGVPRSSDSFATGNRFPMSAAAANVHEQSRQDDMAELMITALRLTREGVALADFQGRYGTSLGDIYGREIEEMTAVGLLELSADTSAAATEPGGQVLRLTKRGRLVGNQVFMRFLD
jgi:oxygen-independent coproporphyrinogen-3 oxidase